MRRQVVAVVVLALISGVAVAGWVIGSRVQSPEAAAAKAAPPDPSLITAPVEFRVLASRVVDRGDVVPGDSQSVAGPQFEDGATVTGVRVSVGDQLAEGNVIVEVSGRPVIVLQGDVPAFRDMKPGMTGTDIEQLQAALSRIGCDTSADEGEYGEATKQCVQTMYDALGFQTLPSSDTEAADLAEARDNVATAEDELATAQDALTKKEEEEDNASELVEQQVAVEDAQRAISQETAAGDEARQTAGAAVDAAIIKLNKEIANRQSAPADRATAVGELEKAVLDAQTADREAIEKIAAAEGTLRKAQAALDESMQAPDVESETLAVEQAEGKLARAADALTELEARTGPMVQLGEVVFVDTLPATVSTLSARVGRSVNNDNQGDGNNSLAVLATAGLRVEALIAASDADLLEVGMEVELRDDLSGDSVEATLVELGNQIVTSEDGNDRGYEAIIEGVDELPDGWVSRNVRVTFTGASTGSDVLVVPVAALSSGGDGEARVQVVGDDNVVTTVSVEPGLSADGFVEVTPIDGELNEGDQVVVGNQDGGAPPVSQNDTDDSSESEAPAEDSGRDEPVGTDPPDQPDESDPASEGTDA